eukprot:TRINITY_DN11520_c0_g1_i5.p3 TRINITY_DN11520_c0_g1~~TRINITY_DN11520_c0_g1_i5.p3  ORF type:complete len:147 (+),score=14.66 TRINITY_DN11520_c0_g1_i5:213-653(+)
MAYSGMTGLSQSTFGFPVETAVAGSPVKMHLFSRTGLVGAVAATPHGEQLFLAGTSMSVFHIDKAWCAAADVANTVLRASKVLGALCIDEPALVFVGYCSMFCNIDTVHCAEDICNRHTALQPAISPSMAWRYWPQPLTSGLDWSC